MKKTLFIICITAILSASGLANAKSNNWGMTGAVSAVTTRLQYMNSDSFYIYCNYITYRKDTGYITNRYTRSYLRSFFNGCPSF